MLACVLVRVCLYASLALYACLPVWRVGCVLVCLFMCLCCLCVCLCASVLVCALAYLFACFVDARVLVCVLVNWLVGLLI